MKYRKLSNTGLFVSEICFGTMTFGGKGMWEVIGTLGQKEANELVSCALDAGVNFFDTANIYSQGESETILGCALAKRRPEVVLATKVMGRMGLGQNEVGLSRTHILQQVEQSLKRLGTDYIDLYQIHAYDAQTDLEDTLRTLDGLVGSGKVRYIGCSNLAAWQAMKAIGISRYQHLEPFKSIQAFYTISNRDIEREIVPFLIDQGLALLVWSPLAGGFLSGKFTRDCFGDENSRRASFDFPPVDREKAFEIIEAMQSVAATHQASVAQVALAWLLHKPYVTSVIIGVKTLEQINDNLKSVYVQFSVDELKMLDEVSKLNIEYPAWNQNWPPDRVPKGS